MKGAGWILRKLADELKEVTGKLNARLGEIEEVFVKKLGVEATGRVALRRSENGMIEHLVFHGGQILVESGRPGRPLSRTPILNASREHRLMAVNRLIDLWVACGGPRPPERLAKADSKV